MTNSNTDALRGVLDGLVTGISTNTAYIGALMELLCSKGILSAEEIEQLAANIECRLAAEHQRIKVGK